jgi:hypothetical protein
MSPQFRLYSDVIRCYQMSSVVISRHSEVCQKHSNVHQRTS